MTQAPETIEGWYVLHDLRRIDWTSWQALSPAAREQAASEAMSFLKAAKEARESDGQGSSGVFAVPGHKGDLLLLHLRPTVDQLLQLELDFNRLEFARHTKQTHSYLSVTELSTYSGRPPEQVLRRRLEFHIPQSRYVSFYPMNKRRGERYNWYALDHEARSSLMRVHAGIGRSYHGRVQQMIGGSMGLDDWEWGVTLFADDPLQIKKIVYEMRFDETSSRYGSFGPFFFGLQLAPDSLAGYLEGRLIG